jgi:hypothetical protein
MKQTNGDVGEDA